MIDMSVDSIPENARWIDCVFINLVSNEAVAIELPRAFLFYDSRAECFRPKDKYRKRLMALVNAMAGIEAKLGIQTAKWKDEMEETDYVVGLPN